MNSTIVYKDVRIELIQGSIANEEADAIVNAANSRLGGGGGVDGAIHSRGGSAIMADTCKRYPKGCPTGSAVASCAGKLSAKYVFHAVAPRFRPHSGSEELLRSAYFSSLSLALEYRIESIAFPSLGTGVYANPLEGSAFIALNTVREFIDAHKKDPDFKLQTIRFVLFDGETLKAYKRRLYQIFPAVWTHIETGIQGAIDYLSEEEVQRYDQRMRTIRNVDEENEKLISLLDLDSKSRILEIGTGTGAFARSASSHFESVVAADISKPMLSFAEKKAREEGKENIQFLHGGFLSLVFPDQTFDGIVSSLALHHLNDVWKAEAITRIYRWLKPGGRFILVDVVFDCEAGDLDLYLEKEIPESMDPIMKIPMFAHIRNEFSTFHWIMDGILERAGFRILAKKKFGSVPHIYILGK
ncbi:MAG: macro domain-containing protein [Planctomycetia bacterium]|nr:macro domain-containing protein [Planctomycetia bacterium]